jgi:hypothetical protein
MKKFLVLGLLLGSLAVVVPGHASPAVAFEFNGTASLPTFPCVPGGCVGSFSGVARGVLENGNSTNAPISASFTYQEANCELGNAQGSGLINGVGFTFNWTRVGNTATITGSYGGHTIRAVAAFAVTSPAVPTMCLPGAAPSAVTATVAGAAAG